MKHILVTGATGFIGYQVSRELTRQGYVPRLLVRRPLRGMLLNTLDADLRQGDLSRPESLKRVITGIDTVIHLGAMATFESYGKIRPSIVDGSVNLMLAAIDEGVKNFVYGGSMLVYNDQRRPINQETGPGPRSGYGRAKFEAEHKMAEMAERAGINFSSVRLPHVYGAKSLLFHKIRQGSIYFPGRGDNVFAHLHVSDAARALIRAAESGKRGVCVVADNLPCTWNEFFAMVQSYYPKLRVVHFPERLALMATGALDILLKYRNAPNQYTLDSVVSWNMSLPVESGTLPNVLGLDPEYPSIADGIPAVLDDCLCFTWCHSNFDH